MKEEKTRMGAWRAGRPRSSSRPVLGSLSQASEPDISWLFSQPLGVVCGQSPRDEQLHNLTCRNYSPSLRKPHPLFTFHANFVHWPHPTVPGHFCPSNSGKPREPRSGRTRGPPQVTHRPKRAKEKLMPPRCLTQSSSLIPILSQDQVLTLL